MPEPMPIPSGPHPSTVAWNKVRQYADRLFDSIESLEESGGIIAAAGSMGWSPKARKKAVASPVAARDAIDRQLGQLRGSHWWRMISASTCSGALFSWMIAIHNRLPELSMRD